VPSEFRRPHREAHCYQLHEFATFYRNLESFHDASVFSALKFFLKIGPALLDAVSDSGEPDVMQATTHLATQHIPQAKKQLELEFKMLCNHTYSISLFPAR
jgi:hypothetical protein